MSNGIFRDIMAKTTIQMMTTMMILTLMIMMKMKTLKKKFVLPIVTKHSSNRFTLSMK
jgi:hypothetical protein